MLLDAIKTALSKTIVGDAGGRLGNDAIDRAVSAALVDYSQDSPRYDYAEFALKTGVFSYDMPADAVGFGSTNWGMERNQYFAGAVITAPKINFSPAGDGDSLPRLIFRGLNDAHIAIFGSAFECQYLATHIVNNEFSSIDNESAFLTRAQAELMRELMTMNVVEPITAHHGMGDADLTGTPQYVYKLLMADYRKRMGFIDAN